MKQVLAGQYLRRVDVLANRYGQIAGVEQHQAQDIVADLLLTILTVAIGCLQAVDLCWAAVIHRP
ncbi:hypothetical protein D3C77_502910 [compost metagenome]